MERKSKISPFGRNDKNRVSEGFARGLLELVIEPGRGRDLIDVDQSRTETDFT